MRPPRASVFWPTFAIRTTWLIIALLAATRCWADVVSEDVYITISKTDGYPAALALRNRVAGTTTLGSLAVVSDSHLSL